MKLDPDDGHVVPSVSGQNRDGQVGNRLKYGKSPRSYTQIAEAGTPTKATFQWRSRSGVMQSGRPGGSGESRI
jgi:hypothetical protein